MSYSYSDRKNVHLNVFLGHLLNNLLISTVKGKNTEDTLEETRALDWPATSMGEGCPGNKPDSWEKMWE